MTLSNARKLFFVVEGLNHSVGSNSLASDFTISAAGEESSDVQVGWRRHPSWNIDKNELLPLKLRKCYVTGKPYVLHLITFPTAIPKDFNLDDLAFPFTIDGLVLNIDLSGISEERNDHALQFQVRLQPLRKGGIRWIKDTNLPCAIVSTSIHSSLISIEEIREAFDLSANMPILPYLGKSREESGPYLFLAYEPEFTQTVLVALIEQVELSNT